MQLASFLGSINYSLVALVLLPALGAPTSVRSQRVATVACTSLVAFLSSSSSSSPSTPPDDDGEAVHIHTLIIDDPCEFTSFQEGS